VFFSSTLEHLQGKKKGSHRIERATPFSFLRISAFLLLKTFLTSLLKAPS